MSAYDTIQPNREAAPEACPFCGYSNPKLVQILDRTALSGRGLWLIHCEVCKAQGGDSTSPTNATTKWNRRKRLLEFRKYIDSDDPDRIAYLLEIKNRFDEIFGELY